MALNKQKEQKAVRVKVKPFPIDAVVTTGVVQSKVQVLKLANQGFLADTKEILFRAGQPGEVHFILPVLNHEIKCHVMVVNVHDRIVGEQKRRQKVLHYTEFHFTDLSPEQQINLNQFFQAIGQR